MKFCTNCGAQLSDDAQYCTNCGTKVNSAETLDNVKVHVTESNVKAPDTEGEFVLASWKDPAPRDTAVRHEEGPKKEEEPKKVEVPKKEEVPQAKEKKQGCLSYILLFGKVLFIAVGSVFLLVFLMEYFSDDKPETPKTEQHQPVKSEESVFPEAEKIEKSDEVESVEDRIYFLEALLQRSEDQLEEELAKGDDADMKVVTDIRDGIARIREELKDLKKQKKTNQ